MNKYNLALFMIAALHTTPTRAMHATHSMSRTHPIRAIHTAAHTIRKNRILGNTHNMRTIQSLAGQSAESATPSKPAALLFLKRACAYSCVGSATLFAGHEWGYRNGYEEGFFAGEIHTTADITKQIAAKAVAWAKKEAQKPKNSAQD